MLATEKDELPAIAAKPTLTLSPPARAAQAARATRAAATDELVGESVFRRRLGMCAACEHYRDQRCAKAGGLLYLKAKRQSAQCPLEKWEEISNSPALAAYTTFRPRPVESNCWVTTDDLLRDTAELCAHLRGDIDAVVGVARSGLMPAQLIACMRHLPLFACRLGWSHSSAAIVDAGNGWRLRDQARSTFRTVLLVDDTAWHGVSMAEASEMVGREFPGAEVLRVAIYATTQCQERLDAWACTYDGVHYLQWNLFNSGHVDWLATDFDGILCPDFTADEDDDGPRYAAALRARPVWQTPRRRPLPAIITARLERYREPTLAWLAQYGIRCRKLVMGPWANLAERSRADVAAWKAEQFLATGLELFVESDPRQARRIYELTGKQVLCPALGIVLE